MKNINPVSCQQIPASSQTDTSSAAAGSGHLTGQLPAGNASALPTLPFELLWLILEACPHFDARRLAMTCHTIKNVHESKEAAQWQKFETGVLADSIALIDQWDDSVKENKGSQPRIYHASSLFRLPQLISCLFNLRTPDPILKKAAIVVEKFVPLLGKKKTTINTILEKHFLSSDVYLAFRRLAIVNRHLCLNLVLNTDSHMLAQHGINAYPFLRDHLPPENTQTLLHALSQILSAPKDDYITLAHFAVRVGCMDIIPELLQLQDYPEHIDVPDAQGRTLLMIAGELDNEQLFQKLLEWGANIQVWDKRGRTALFYACNNLSMTQRLLNRGADPKACTHVNDTNTLMPVLLFACQAGNLEVAQALIQAGADPDYRDAAGNTPLLLACSTGIDERGRRLVGELEADAIRQLLDARGTITARFSFNAAQYRHATRLLLDAGRTITARSSFNAAQNRLDSTLVVKLLLEYDVDVNAQDRNGCTALMWACQNGAVTTVQLLLTNGARTDLKDEQGFTALEHVTQRPLCRFQTSFSNLLGLEQQQLDETIIKLLSPAT